MVSTLLQAALICSSTWLLWRVFRHLVVKSDLNNLPGPPSSSLVYGNLKQLRDRQGWTFHRELSEKYASIAALHGPLGHKMLFVHDPRAMHHMAVKEQDVFEEPAFFLSITGRVFGLGLLATTGEHHRKQRKMLNPVFSVNHMRHTLPIFYNVTHKLREGIAASVRGGSAEVNILGWMGRVALEIVGQAGLGYSFDRLVQDTSDPYGDALKSFMPALASVGALIQLLPLCEATIPERWMHPLAALIPHSGLQRMMTIAGTMRAKSTEIFTEKKRALDAGDEAVALQVGEGKDVMSMLPPEFSPFGTRRAPLTSKELIDVIAVRANMASSEEERLPEEELIGQMSTITFGAMDSTSNALSHTLWRLAQRPDVQEKLRREILDAQEAFGSQDIGHDELVALPYLEAVCRETLRVHVPAPFRFREARQDAILPLSKPIRGLDGKFMSEIHVPKGTTIFASITSSNTNPEIWGADAYEWRPERWLEPLPESLTEAKMPGVYSHLMTFWAGGRACIGFRFALLEMKVVLAVLLSTFKFELTETPIVWNLAFVSYPSVKADGSKPEMPLKVTLLERRRV